MAKQTAANSALLAEIKSGFNGKIYKRALDLMNAEGVDAVLVYLGQFFNDEVRVARLAELRGVDPVLRRVAAFLHLVTVGPLYFTQTMSSPVFDYWAGIQRANRASGTRCAP